MLRAEKPLKVGKTDTYSFVVNPSWLEDESLTSVNITYEEDKVTVNAYEIKDNTIVMLLTGVSVGSSKIHLDYTTPNRSDCDEFLLLVRDC